jgi:hypothetical protein
MCQKKEKKKTMQEQLNQTPKHEDFFLKQKKLDPPKNPAELPSNRIALCKKNEKKLTTNPPVPAGSRDQGCRP